ncbi:MAG: hypothetical protein Q9213_004632 [Squamulea squamosa]
MEQSEQQVLKPIPRFGSFRFHAQTTPPEPGAISKPDRNSSSSGTHDVTSRHHHHRSKRLSHTLKPQRIQKTSPAPEPDFVQWDDSPVVFDVDLDGDPRNLEYRSSYGTPSYHQPWHNRTLGLKTSFGSGVHHIGVLDRGKTSLSKQIRSDFKNIKSRRINLGASPGLQSDAGADFVPLQDRKARKRKHEGHLISRISSRSPKSRFQDSAEDESDLDSAADAGLEDASDQSFSEDYGARASALHEDPQRKRVALSSCVDRDPSNWRAWVALVDFQDELDGVSDAFSRRPHRNAERKSNAEICLSIYSKALKSVVDPEGRERLYLGMMSKAPIVWEPRKLSAHWQSIINQHPLSLQLWKKYLDFYQSAASGFTIEDNKQRHIDCLSMLQGVRHSKDSKKAQKLAAYAIQVQVLLRLTILLREAGYTELAVAMWQAALEFEFNKPTNLRRLDSTSAAKPTYDESVLAFEQFWDSEAPRIGEHNAKGWLHCEDHDIEQIQPPKPEEVPIRRGTNLFKSWADAEYKAYGSSILPGHTVDEPSDDPYKTVLFSDVRHALVESPTPVDNRAIITAFLCFCHLPPSTDCPKGQAETWYDNQYVRTEILYDRTVSVIPKLRSQSSVLADAQNSSSGISTTITTTDSCLPSVFAFPIPVYEISSDALFAAPDKWFCALGSWTECMPKDFILRTLRLLVDRGIGGDSLVEYLLAFEMHVSPVTVKKSARSLLKKRPSSLRLYDTYAQIEVRQGNIDAANGVWDTAIHMSAKFDDAARRDAILLWRSRLWQYFSSGLMSEALQQISRYGSEGAAVPMGTDGKLSDGATTTVHLRLRNASAFSPLYSAASDSLTASQTFSAGRDHMLSLGLLTHAVIYSELLFLSDYLLNTTSIQAAHASFTTNLPLLTKNNELNNRRAEALFRQSFARLLYTHTTQKRPISPATIRSFLTESISAFPHNTIFLSLYAWNESRFRIDDRVRGIMRDIVFSSNKPNNNNEQKNNNYDDSEHISTHFFAVYTDMQRGTIQGSNQSAVRGTFERALSDAAAAHSAGLWKWYFLYEYRNGDLKRAREVYYRAVRACPWAKEIYMLGFEYLSEEMPEGELRGVYDMMVERELRIHVAL